MPTIIVNGKEIEIEEGQRLNGVQAAALAGVEIPHYCWHPGLSVVASCRMCLVESGRRNAQTGEIEMVPKLVPACQTPAVDGAVFITDSEKVKAARAMVEEDLLIRHPIDCPICDKAGECSLQDYHYQHGRGERRADIKPFTSRRTQLGATVTLFIDRCVMCTRCVRFCREVTETSELMVSGRGAHEHISVFPGFPLDNKLAGNVVDLCPVGALGDRDFLYQQRVWFMRGRDNVCAGCASGCSIQVEENQDRIYRLKPRENMHVNQWWMCDEGRYGFKHVHDDRRLTQPRRRVDGELVNVEWSELPEQIDAALKQAGRLAVVLSPHLTVEEAYLLAQYARGMDDNALLAVGPVPRRGEDETYCGQFTISAEKCPNRRGVEKVAAALGDGLVSWEEFLQRVEQDQFAAVWITGGYKTDWINEAEAEKLAAAAGTLIVQDMFPTPLWQRADFQLPGAAFAEREGSYVNRADRLQSFTWAIRPPQGVQVEGRLYWRLLEKSGMYNARSVLDEVTREIGFFAVAVEEVPPTGLDLRANLLAESAEMAEVQV